MGRACAGIKAGYRRMEHGRHVILYREQSNGILIVRVLHQRMLPRIHILE
jgi:toxin ParE1/3/4